MNTNESRHLPLSVAVVFAVAIAISIWAPAPDTTAAQPAPNVIDTSSESFFYYPAQYVNQAKELEPHIQAF